MCMHIQKAFHNDNDLMALCFIIYQSYIFAGTDAAPILQTTGRVCVEYMSPKQVMHLPPGLDLLLLMTYTPGRKD